MRWQRTHTCGDLRGTDKDAQVILVGWVASARDHGGVIFVDLRDRWGRTQVVFNPDTALIERAKRLKMESVIGVVGKVILRPDDMINKNIPTGQVEVIAEQLEIFNEAKPMPFVIKDPPEALDETRLKYRYLDLRRASMQQNMLLRHRTAQLVRQYFNDLDFVEIETPVLMKSTPEGARDYLVPSRIHKGKFYALPQSPQTYKQLLMVSGFDRYYQIVKCFRDEDLRADRQPEFTQIDVEMSFVDEQAIFDIIEGLYQKVMKEMLGLDVQLPLQRISYKEAMTKYGVDRPDVRFGMEIRDVSDIAVKTEFKVFRDVVEQGGFVRGILLPGAAPYSRKQVDDLIAFIKPFGATGLVPIQYLEEEIRTPVSKFLSEEILKSILERFGAKIGDIVFLVASKEKVVCDSLGNLRNKFGAEYKLYDSNTYKALWVTEFPLLDWDQDAGRFVAMHHPFTSPHPEDIPLMETDPGKIRARAYDLVLNGSEVAGGSIRIHQSSVQAKMFDLLGIQEETAKIKFGYLIEALNYGAPPHGGIAFGFDRLVAMLAKEGSIREVIAFPKTTSALSLMDGCPSQVDSDQLEELGLKLDVEILVD